jgi:hypothetical protein
MMLLDSTDGSEIIWSKGEPGEQWAPDLYSFTPGASGPTLTFRDQNRNAQLNTIAVHHGKYAFEELFTNPAGTTGWRLWFIEAKGTKPIVLDSNSNDPQGLPVPAIWPALTDDQITWNAVHMVNGEETWSLRSYDIRAKATRTLIQASSTKTEYWFPDVDDRGRLVYSTVEYGPDKQATPGYHVYLANLSDSQFRPRELDTDGLAAEPVLSGDGDTVIWKTVTPPMSVANWGQLARYSLSNGQVEQVYFDDQPMLDYETAGNRYVAAWGSNSTSFNLYDLVTGTSLWVEKHEPTGSVGVGRPVVSGDLVAFVRSDDSKPGGQNKWLCYAKLPPHG